MKIDCIRVGQLSTNCYIAYDEDKKEGIIIDPGAEAKKIISRVKSLGLNIKYIVFTHVHFDHILAYPEIANEFKDSKLIVSHKENDALCNKELSLVYYSNKNFPEIKADILVKNDDLIKFGNESFKVIETPGHTKGSMSLLSNNILISGDTLFKYSIGRCDFPTGSLKDEINSIINILFKLNDNTAVYPGHGPETSIGFEKVNNEVYQWI